MPAVTYFPGSSRLNEARLISLAPEQESSNVSFALQAVPQAVVSGSVVTSAGTPPASFSIRVQRLGGPPGEVRCLLTGLAAGASKEQTFRCPNVPPGDFWVVAASRAVAGGPVEFGGVRLTVAGRDVQNLSIATAPGVPVSGRVEVEGGGALPAGVQVTALETEFEYPSPGGVPATPAVSPNTDGRFTFPALAGPRLFRLQRLPDDWALKAGWIDSTEISDTPIALSADRPQTLRLVVTQSTGSIEGTVMRSDRLPAPARMVVAFADDDRRWGARSRFIRIAETNASGRYLIRGLLPGSYCVAFVEQLDDGAWEDPEVLARLRQTSAKVMIKATERIALDGRVR
jgi:hypothetical protein